MVDFAQNFQVRAKSQEEANAIMEALHEFGCRWNAYKERTIYNVWAKNGGNRVLYGAKIDPLVKLYPAGELLQELYEEDNDQDLNIESIL